jgi:hypothetical protein
VEGDGPTPEEGTAGGLADRGTSASHTWRRIETLGEAVGGYCWLERRMFEVTGSCATAHLNAAVPAEIPVFLAAVSRRHGTLAERWADRLPVRAGVDPSALVRPPPGLPRDVAAHLSEAALSEAELGTEASGAGHCLEALVGIVLPWLAGEYQAHLVVASPVSEAPVMEVLVEARRVAVAEAEGGRRLLERPGEKRTRSSASPAR